MDMIPSSLARLQRLVQKNYSKCRQCEERDEDRLRVLPCLHVVCIFHLERALKIARERTRGPESPTKYKDFRRFLCPICVVPLYLHSEEISSYPRTPPIKDLLSVEKLSGTENGLEVQPAGDRESRMYLTRMGDFFFHSEIGNHGTDPYAGCFTRISGLAADERNRKAVKLMVCDAAMNTVTIMDLDGRVLNVVVTNESLRNICLRKDNYNIVASVSEKNYGLVEWDHSGKRVKEFLDNKEGFRKVVDCEPFGVAWGPEGLFTVSLLQDDTIFGYDEDKARKQYSVYGGRGKGSCQFNGPYFLTKTSQGFTVVSDTGNHRIKVHNQATGHMKAKMGGKGSRPGELFYPQGVCVDAEDNIYVADSGNYRVQVFTDLGGYVSSPVVETWNYGQKDQNIHPTQVCVLNDGQLLVAMKGEGYCKIHIYRPRYGSFNETEVKSGSCCHCCLGCCHVDYEPIN